MRPQCWRRLDHHPIETNDTMPLISEIWAGLREAGLPEVMLYLADGSASRCHWDDTALIGETRTALLADQDRQIVRIVPVETCVGIGVASPKGIDPSGYKLFVQNKLRRLNGEFVDEPTPEPMAPPPQQTPAPVAAPAPPPPIAPPIEPAAAMAAKPDPLTSRWGAMKPAAAPARFGGAAQGRA